jgi:hypothetical protein
MKGGVRWSEADYKAFIARANDWLKSDFSETPTDGALRILNELEKPKRRKYGNKPVTIDGIDFQSTFEGDYYCEAKLRKKAGEILDFKMQVRYDFYVNGALICYYKADFVETYPDGRVEVVDTKGVKTAVYEIKKKLMLACHGIAIKEVFRK